MTNLNIKLHHGLVNSTPEQRSAGHSLGLNKEGKIETGEETPALRGRLVVVLQRSY